MFATRSRCVSITPFDTPVVPLENGNTAKSAHRVDAARPPPSRPLRERLERVHLRRLREAARSGPAAI